MLNTRFLFRMCVICSCVWVLSGCGGKSFTVLEEEAKDGYGIDEFGLDKEGRDRESSGISLYMVMRGVSEAKTGFVRMSLLNPDGGAFACRKKDDSVQVMLTLSGPAKAQTWNRFNGQARYGEGLKGGDGVFDLYAPDKEDIRLLGFIPYHWLEVPEGEHVLNVKLEQFLGRPDSASAEPVAHMLIEIPFRKPKLRRFQVSVPRLQLDTTEFKAHEMDFDLSSHARRGFPDLYWNVSVEGERAFRAYRQKNTIDGTFDEISYPIYLADYEKEVRLCAMDWDNGTLLNRDDVMECWEGNADEVPTVISQKEIGRMEVRWEWLD